MPLRCCKCGQQSSSSSSSSRSSVSSISSVSAFSVSQSASSQSLSASSESTDLSIIPCLTCKDNIAPAIFKMEWTLQNNCPNTVGSGTVDCFDQNVGPHGNIYSIDYDPLGPSFRCYSPLPGGCFWKNNSTGQVQIDITGRGVCGDCSNGPAIVIAISRYPTTPGNYTYAINCFVYYYFNCFFVDDPGPPAAGVTYLGYVFLQYQKLYEDQPPNCLFPQDLDLVCHDGLDEYTNPEGTVDWWGVGPGCNISASYGVTFPSTVTISIDEGGGLFP